MSLIGTRTPKLKVLGSESGQGVVEYLLVIAITVMLIGSFIYQFSTAFRQYANSYFGDYIACLLESGELPGQTTASQCTSEFNTFSLANGKTASGGSLTSGSSGSGGSGSGSSNSSGSGSGGSNGRSSKKSSSSSSSGSSSSGSSTVGENVGPGGSSGSGMGYGSRSNSRKTTAVKTSSAPNSGDGGKGREGLRPVGAVSSSNSSTDAGGRGRRTRLSSDFGFAGQQEEERRDNERPLTKAVGKDDADHLKPAKAVQEQPRAPASTADDGGSGFTLGNFLRILIIAGILIAIFILFGGQLLAISKSGEK